MRLSQERMPRLILTRVRLSMMFGVFLIEFFFRHAGSAASQSAKATVAAKSLPATIRGFYMDVCIYMHLRIYRYMLTCFYARAPLIFAFRR